MCRFKSGIILKSKVVVASGENDSHSDLLDSLGIEDNYIGASKVFVRAELVPKDNQWWIDPAKEPENWTFVVDQDIVPDWFDREEHEKIFRETVCGWWKEHVLVDQKLDELSNGYYRLKRCEVKKLLNDVKVLLDSSQIGTMLGSSQIGTMLGSSRVDTMLGSSRVDTMLGSSRVDTMLGSSRVGEMWGSSQIGTMWGSSRVGTMWGSSQVGEMWDNSQIDTMRDSSQIGKMWGKSTARDFKYYPKIKIWVSPEGTFEMVTHKNKEEEHE